MTHERIDANRHIVVRERQRDVDLIRALANHQQPITRLFDDLLDLFRDDTASLLDWMRSPNVGARGRTPLECATDDEGAEHVKRKLKCGLNKIPL